MPQRLSLEDAFLEEAASLCIARGLVLLHRSPHQLAVLLSLHCVLHAGVAAATTDGSCSEREREMWGRHHLIHKVHTYSASEVTLTHTVLFHIYRSTPPK